MTLNDIFSLLERNTRFPFLSFIIEKIFIPFIKKTHWWHLKKFSDIHF